MIIILGGNCPAAEVEIRIGDGRDDMSHLITGLAERLPDSLVVDSIRTVLINSGYLDAAVLADVDDGRPVLEVIPGAPYDWRYLILEGDPIDTLIIGESFQRAVFERAIDSIIGDYRNRGSYFVSLQPTRFIRNDGLIDVFAVLNPGPVVTVSGIILDGLRKTRPEFIERYIDLKPGDTLYPETLTGVARRLDRLGFVEFIRPSRIIPSPDFREASLQFDLVEKNQFDFEGGGGYIPDDGGEFVWYFNLRGRNIFGGGQKAGLEYDRRQIDRSVFSVSYGQPLWLFGYGDLMVDVKTRDYRRQFYEFTAGLSYQIWLGRQLSAGVGLRWKNVEPADDSSRSFHVYEAGFSLQAGELQAARNAPANFSLDWDIRYSGRRYRAPAGETGLIRGVYDDTRNELAGRGFIPLTGPLAYYQKAAFRDIESSEKPLPLSELYTFGGLSVIRGYRTDQFAARKVASFNTELWLFFSKNDLMYVFIDGAYFDRYLLDSNLAVYKKDSFRSGYGFGFQSPTPAGLFRLELAWGEGAAFDEPRLNVRLATGF